MAATEDEVRRHRGGGGQGGGGSVPILNSLRYYLALRRNRTITGSLVRDGTLDLLLSSPDDETTTKKIPLVHLFTIMPFTTGGYALHKVTFEDAASVLLAVEHLNTGDGSIVPEVDGLDQKCPVRFTTEFADTQFNPGVALHEIVQAIHRSYPAEHRQIPTAFIGAYRSAVSMPTSIVTGIFGYPQISPASASVALDDKSQYPLFGRANPSDQGNTIPIVMYIYQVLKIKHLVVINVNDAYGNAHVEGMRMAAAKINAQDLVLTQIPLDGGDEAIKAAVQTIKSTNFRFIYGVIFTRETHDALMLEAYEQGVAGTGVHNWLFADTFVGVLNERTIPVEPPALRKAYRGVASLESTGGVPGIANYDKYAAQIAELKKHAADLRTMEMLLPKHPNQESTYDVASLIRQDNFLDPLINGLAPFSYEATIGLGLAACSIYEENVEFTGEAHYEAFKNTTFTGVSGRVVIDRDTGTRDPESALLKVANWLEEEGSTEVDPETGEEVVRFYSTLTDVFQNGAWVQQKQLVFNDGTTNLPADLPPQEEVLSLGLIVTLPVILTVFLGIAVYSFFEHKKRQNDSVWLVEREHLSFSDPPQIVGRGTFGLVLLAEYRGTMVAVKRVIPPKSARAKDERLDSAESCLSKDDQPIRRGSAELMNGAERRGSIGLMNAVERRGSMGLMNGAERRGSMGRINGAERRGSMGRMNGVERRGSFGLVNGAERRGSMGHMLNVVERRGSMGHMVNVVERRGSMGLMNGAEQIIATTGQNGIGLLSGAELMSGSNDGFGSCNNGASISFLDGFLDGPIKTVGCGGTGAKECAIWRKMKKDFVEEMRYISKLRHPCVTTIMGAVLGKDPLLVMEYMEHGSLYDLLHNETMAIEGELLLPILRDIAQGMRFLHSASPKVLHGDLKAANILVDGQFRAKVADFGLSQKKAIGGTGTPFWMAPELLRKESANTTATDAYSFGIILYEVYSRCDPYYDEDDPYEVLRLIGDKQVQKRPPTPDDMPTKVKVLMADCVDDDAEKRPTFEELDIRLKRMDAEGAEPTTQSTSPKANGASVSLFDIFPHHIAEALQEGRRVEAEHKDCVTIFFSDIVGFTEISARLTPQKVALMLDRLYTKFDNLSEKYDVFKVETIGDAYMAVSNLVKDQKHDHCKRIAEFATEAVIAANNTYIDLDDLAKGCMNIRVGLHIGPVVADVVGTRNPRYCLFGDTVNTASRMESTSIKNRIHCSKSAAALLQKQCPSMPLQPRGKIPIKGKGNMTTFWVNDLQIDNSKGVVEVLEEVSAGMSVDDILSGVHDALNVVDSTPSSPRAVTPTLQETAPIVLVPVQVPDESEEEEEDRGKDEKSQQLTPKRSHSLRGNFGNSSKGDAECFV